MVKKVFAVKQAPAPEIERTISNHFSPQLSLYHLTRNFLRKSQNTLLLYIVLLLLSAKFQLLWREAQTNIGTRVESNETADLNTEIFYLIMYFLLPRVLLIICQIHIAKLVNNEAKEQVVSITSIILNNGEKVISENLQEEVAQTSFYTSSKDFFTALFVNVIPAGLDSLVGYTMITQKAPVLSLPIAAIFIFNLAIDFGFHKKMWERNKKAEEYKNKFNKTILYVVTDLKEILLNNLQPLHKKLTWDSAKDYFDDATSMNLYAKLSEILKHSFLFFILYKLIFTLSTDYKDNFRLCLSFISYILWPLEVFSKAIPNLLEASVKVKIVYEKINQLQSSQPHLDMPFDQEIPRSLILKNPSLIIENLSYQIPNDKILEYRNLTFEPGKKYCLVGKNGSGKSTLADLITSYKIPRTGRIYLTSGEVKIECNIENKYTIRNIIGVVSQNARIDGCSGGEAQIAAIRLQIKRKPQILILDEPDTALDDTNRDHLRRILDRKEVRKMTVLYITHNLSELSYLHEKKGFEKIELTQKAKNPRQKSSSPS